ncbi:MAG: NUDIX hydrolase [Hyphomicrobium sp.]|uniref:NUDIX domain-containing protein n=1 Tax=Hyphomicrobium sp. TaxID=82 RepID=UPI0039E26256
MRHYACAILVDGERLLLGFRAAHKKILPCKWDVLGGMVEPGETLEAALVRELHEEIGVVPQRFDRLGSVVDPNEIERGGATYHLFKVSSWAGGSPEIRNYEHTHLAWFTLAEALALPDLALEEYLPFFEQALNR